MQTLVLPLLFIHSILYLAWKITANKERNTRERGNEIPTFATGGLGDLIGFSLVVTGAGLSSTEVPTDTLFITIFCATLLVTISLHFYWKNYAKGTITSLYLPNGKVTLAGMLHLIYVFFIIAIVMMFLTKISTSEPLPTTLFAASHPILVE